MEESSLKKHEKYLISAGFDDLEGFVRTRLAERLRVIAAGNLLFSYQSKEITLFSENINTMPPSALPPLLASLGYDWDAFVSEELHFYYVEKIRILKSHILFFRKKYGLKSAAELSEKYRFFIDTPDYIKAGDETVWEAAEGLCIDFSERLNDLLNGN